jgi:PAS domain S-box-containing protein
MKNKIDETDYHKQIDICEAKFQQLISQAPVAITTLKGPYFIVETVNKITLEIWGKSYEEVINKPLFESSPELEDGLKNLLTSVLKNGESLIANEIPVKLKRLGKPVTAYFNSVYQSLRDVDKNIYGIIIIGTEVTEAVNARKQTEASELFSRTILESSPDCLKVLDSEGRIQFMNFNGLCQMEIDDFSTFKNKNWWTLWGSDNEALVKAAIHKALTGETAQFIALCPTAKGIPKWWDVLVSPVGNASEPVKQIIAVSRDITEQKNLQAALVKLNETLDLKNIALENANAELESFSYIASHDLQEPLRMIKKFSERITKTEKFSDKTRQYFNFIIDATKRMRSLIVSLFNYSRMDKTELNFVLCDLNIVVEESKRDLRLRIVEKQAIIDCDLLPTINGLHIQLCQVFTNLIGNAIKYSQPNIVPYIKITVERSHGKDISRVAANKQLDYCVIKIADNGIGFEEEFAVKIFEVFKRLHGRDDYSGTGIGLSIVKKIVTNHNGFIVAEGKLGIGSIFTIYLPTT